MVDVHNISNVSATLENKVTDINSNLANVTVKGQKGDKGDDGFSPIVSMSKSGDTTTLSITDKTGTKTSLIKDGAKGDSYVLTEADKEEIASKVEGGKVDDVKVNGTSVVTNKIANIDLSTKQDKLDYYTEATVVSAKNLYLATVPANTVYIQAKVGQITGKVRPQCISLVNKVLNGTPQLLKEYTDYTQLETDKQSLIDLECTCTVEDAYKNRSTFTGDEVYHGDEKIATTSDITVTDVQINGTSIVENKVANITTQFIANGDEYGRNPIEGGVYLYGTEGTLIGVSKGENEFGSNVAVAEEEIALYQPSGIVKLYSDSDAGKQLATEDYVGTSLKQYAPYFAPYYDATKTYAVGDVMLYKYKPMAQGNINATRLYKCISAITTPENFNSSHWQLLTGDTKKYIGDYLFNVVTKSETVTLVGTKEDGTTVTFNLYGGEA